MGKNIPITIEDRLIEHDMGIYEGVNFEDLDWKIFWEYDSDLQYSKLESMKNVYKRITDFLNELRSKEKDKNILLVTHGGVARAIYWYFNGLDYSLSKCENCKIYEYHID